jgi:hypothetical protein
MINDLTQNEQDIILFLREAKPFETVTVQKDANGKPDYYIIKREQKIYLTNKFN